MPRSARSASTRNLQPIRRRAVRGMTARIVEDLVSQAPALLTAQDQPDELWVRDTDLKGFVVKLRASGKHTYGIAFARGKFLNLGGTDRLTAGKARKAAKDALAETALTGAPARVEVKAGLTLRVFLDEHYEPWAATTLKSAVETVARIRIQFAGLLKASLVDVTPFAVERVRVARLKAERGARRSTVMWAR